MAASLSEWTGVMRMHYGKCFLCGEWGLLEDHHIFGGSNRKKSEQYGLKVGLCGIKCHREGPKAVHRCAETAQKIHEYGQYKYMREHNATVDEFRSLFGRNYLDLPVETGGAVLIEQARGLLSELHSSGRLEYHEYSLLWDALDELESRPERSDEKQERCSE